MDASQMLHQMCHQVLSNADVSAIRRSRGFSAQEVASRGLLENFFLSDTGVEVALRSLTREEAALLHLLQLIDREVGIPLFARICGDDSRAYYGTFTQRYGDVFREVRHSLIRKGLLLIAEDRSLLSADTKMERWRIRFPQQFGRLLPSPFESTRTFEGSGDIRSDVLRHKLMEISRGSGRSPVGTQRGTDSEYDLRLVHADSNRPGELRVGDRDFRARYLLEWQQARWADSLPSPKSLSTEEALWRRVRSSEQGAVVPPIEAATYLFSQLGENEWARPGELSLPLRIFSDRQLDGAQLCDAGWRWGCLARQEAGGRTYYRPPQEGAGIDVEPGRYLHPMAEGPVSVDLNTVPYPSLEHLARISNLRVAGTEEPCLLAAPNLIKMGMGPAFLRNRPLTQWLRENAPPFRQALESVEQRWGRQILHQDLMIAQVNDLGLRVQLERIFPDRGGLVFLSGEYIAFPRGMLVAVEKAVIESGHVIKVVEHNG